MSEEFEPLGSLALRALAAEQRRGDVDHAMQDRLLTRVVASVAVGTVAAAVASTAAPATAAAAGNAGGIASGATAAAAGNAGGIASGATSAAATGLTVKAMPWIVAAFVAGGGAGAAVHAVAVSPSAPSSASPPMRAVTGTTVTPPANVSTVPDVPSMPASALPSARRSDPPVAPVAVPVSPRTSASVAPPGSANNDVDLAAERALVDRARAALSRGQGRDALDALEAHASRYPHGRLSEEREALAIDALARAGRHDAARTRATRFRASYPNSVFAAVVDAAVPR